MSSIPNIMVRVPKTTTPGTKPSPRPTNQQTLKQGYGCVRESPIDLSSEGSCNEIDLSVAKKRCVHREIKQFKVDLAQVGDIVMSSVHVIVVGILIQDIYFLVW